MRKFSIAILIWSCVCSIGFCTEIKTIAVIDFGAQNTSASDAAIISDFLRTELVKKECFKVVDKTNMTKILEEQKFQYTGCTDQICAVQIGKVLNVQLMVIGLYSKLEELRYLTANIVDVETGEIIISEKMKFEEVKDINKVVEKLAEKLVRDVYKEKFYDIAKLKRWHGIGIRGGYLLGERKPWESVRSHGVGGDLFYDYIFDSGLGMELNLGFYTRFYPQSYVTEINYFLPIVVNYHLLFEKSISPFLGIGLHYWWRRWDGENGANFMLTGGMSTFLSQRVKLSFAVKHFLTGSMNNLDATVVGGGIIYPEKCVKTLFFDS
ncbi:MAG: CsgG/HfaB family protein [Elusimicrobiota bacterium]